MLVALLVGAARSGAQPSAQASSMSCVPPGALPHLFQGAEYRAVRAQVRVNRGKLVGQVLHDPCGDVVVPCEAVECIEVPEPVRLTVARIRGIRPSVAVAQRAPSPILYVRAGLCRDAGAGRTLLRCLGRASRTAPALDIRPATGRADLRVELTAGGRSADSLVAVAHVENRGPSYARNVVVSFGFGGSVTVRQRSRECGSLALCALGDLAPGQLGTVYVGYARVPPDFAPLGAVATAATRDPDPRSNRAFTTPVLDPPPTAIP